MLRSEAIPHEVHRSYKLFYYFGKTLRNFSRNVSENLNFQNATKKRDSSSNVLGRVFEMLTQKGILQTTTTNHHMQPNTLHQTEKKEIARAK